MLSFPDWWPQQTIPLVSRMTLEKLPFMLSKNAISLLSGKKAVAILGLPGCCTVIVDDVGKKCV